MKSSSPRLAIALAALGALAATTLGPGPAAAADSGPQRIAVVLDPAPRAEVLRQKMADAASLTVLGLAGTREQELVAWAVLAPGGAAQRQTLSQSLGVIRGWQGAKAIDDPAVVAAARAWVGAKGHVVHIGPSARAGERVIAVAVGPETPVIEAVALALQEVWRDDPRVRVLGPAKRIDVQPGVAQQTVISLDSARPSGVETVFGEWDEKVERSVWAWYARPPGLSNISADRPVIAIMTTVDVRITQCPSRDGKRAQYVAWPAGVAEQGLKFSITGSGLPGPLDEPGTDGFVQHEVPLYGAFTISPYLSVGGGGERRAAGPERRCEVWPEVVATPRIDVQGREGDGQIRVSFVDLNAQPIPAKRVFDAGPLSVQVTRAGAAEPTVLPLGIDGDVAFTPLPSSGGETMTLHIEAEKSAARLLGSATATIMPPDVSGAAAPWLIGLAAALLVALVTGAWPWLGVWLTEHLPGGEAPVGSWTVEVGDTLIDQQRLDGETLYPRLAHIMRPMPLGGQAGAAKLVRLELVRGLRGVRVVAHLEEDGRVRILSRRLSTATPWQYDGLTVRFGA